MLYILGIFSVYRYGHQASPEHRVVHKSLPDLHTQPSSGTRESCSNRSASNKSLSNRDSGESSGHYTHRSEPAPCSEPPRPEIRRDSGSSTQHSGASIYCCTGYYIIIHICNSPLYKSRPENLIKWGIFTRIVYSNFINVGIFKLFLIKIFFKADVTSAYLLHFIFNL